MTRTTGRYTSRGARERRGHRQRAHATCANESERTWSHHVIEKKTWKSQKDTRGQKVVIFKRQFRNKITIHKSAPRAPPTPTTPARRVPSTRTSRQVHFTWARRKHFLFRVHAAPGTLEVFDFASPRFRLFVTPANPSPVASSRARCLPLPKPRAPPGRPRPGPRITTARHAPACTPRVSFQGWTKPSSHPRSFKSWISTWSVTCPPRLSRPSRSGWCLVRC